MKLRKSGQVLLAAAASLGTVLGITSCSTSNTVDIVFVTASKNNPGQIGVYYADSESGALTQIKDSPFPSGGRNPVAEVVSPDFKYLYVANRDDNNIVQFGIGTDGKLYPNQTCNTPGASPSSLAISPDGTQLYVLDFYGPTAPGGPVYSAANPGPGALVVFPVTVDATAKTDTLSCTPVTQSFVDANNATQTASYVPVGISPTGVAVTPFPTQTSGTSGSSTAPSYVYVTAQNGLPGGANTNGIIDAFGVTATTSGAQGGVLSVVGGSPFAAGTSPSALAVDPSGRFLYITDSRQNQLLLWTILGTGALSPNQNGPFRTDTSPVSLVIDPTDKYIYVANFVSGDVSAFAIGSTGTPSAVAGASAYATGAGPNCVFVDPSLGRFVYTANFNDNTVTGFTLNINTGALTSNQNSPYLAAGQPTCVAGIPHGNHATQAIQPLGGS